MNYLGGPEIIMSKSSEIYTSAINSINSRVNRASKKSVNDSAVNSFDQLEFSKNDEEINVKDFQHVIPQKMILPLNKESSQEKNKEEVLPKVLVHKVPSKKEEEVKEKRSKFFSPKKK